MQVACACALLASLAPASAAPSLRPLSVFAAASLCPALQQLDAAWQRAGHAPLRLVCAGSSALARQIEAGAPADVFISANLAWMDALATRGLIVPATRRVLLSNALVLVAPAGAASGDDARDAAAGVDAASLAQWLGTGRLALADPAVPAGTYAIAALRSLGAWPALQPRVAWTQDVRAALALVARGEVPLGIVYRSDAHGMPDVRVIGTFAPATHPPIRYPAAVVATSGASDAAAFVDFLGGDEASAVFARAGFERPASLASPTAPAVTARTTLGFTSDEWTSIRLSLKVALWAVAGSLLPALGVAMLLARGRFRGRALLHGLVHLPLLLPPVVTGYVLLLLFGAHGVLGRWLASLGVVFAFRWTGAALAGAVMGFPLLVRSIQLSIEAVDRRLEGVAQTLGANRALTFATVTLPLIAPGIGSGVVLTFARAMGEFGATITFVSSIPGLTRTLPLAVYGALQTPGAVAEQDALRLVLLSVAVSLAAMLAAEALLRRARRGMAPA